MITIPPNLGPNEVVQVQMGVQAVLDDLIARAKNLQHELEALRSHLRDLRQEGTVELGHFRGTVQSELSMLERLSQKPNDESKTHIARSSNLPFLETLWNTVKYSRDVISLQKRVYTSSITKALSQRMGQVDINSGNRKNNGSRDAGVVVDAIVDGGLTWIKVSLTSNSRLIFDLAKQGWNSDNPESEHDDDDDTVFFRPPNSENEDDDDVALIKSCKELTRAAQCFRIKTQTPKVHFILPRIQPHQTTEVDGILETCRATGAHLFCGPDLAYLQQSLPLSTCLSQMVRDPLGDLTPTLNIDCTILLALVSEFSHANVSKEPWFHASLRRQVEIEGNENLLPALLYPAMSDRDLVCTLEAMVRMREIVDTIGTPSEKARTAILLGDDASKTQSELLSEMQSWSAHTVPADWQLPVRVVPTALNNSVQTQSLPEQARQVCSSMTPINRSVFCYGWAKGITTITSNRTVVKQIHGELEKTFVDLPDEVWPRVWLCPTARSLVGKEKRGAPKVKAVTDENTGAENEGPGHGDEVGSKEGKKRARPWPLPDPLRREEQRLNGLDVLSQRSGYEVEDLRPNGYDYEDVIQAKNASIR